MADQRLLTPRWQEFLAGLPESGMGYQRIAVRLAGGRTIEATVIQGSLVSDWPSDVDFRPEEIVSIELIYDGGRPADSSEQRVAGLARPPRA